MTDQAVETDGVRLSGHAAAEDPFLGRARELKELRADIDRAGLDTLSGKKAPRARVLGGRGGAAPGPRGPAATRGALTAGRHARTDAEPGQQQEGRHR